MMMRSGTELFSTSPIRHKYGKWRVTVLLFVLSLFFLFFASLQYGWPGKWWNSASTLKWQGEALTLKKGRGSNIQGGFIVDGLVEPGIALATLSPPVFQAENYPVVHWHVSSTKPNTKVEFLWRTSENPNRIFARELEWAGSSVEPLDMSGDANWRGQVMELMLMVHAPLNAPLVIEAVKAEAPLGIVWREWFGAEPWLGTSINFVGGNESRQWLGPLPFIAIALALAMLGYWLLAWRKTLVFDLGAVWVLVFIAWFALDMRWQIDLWHKLSLTQQRYAGKSWKEKHLAAEDGSLFGLMQQIKAMLPPTASRVFVVADDEYMRYRSAYHLYPFNVFATDNLLPEGYFKSGDFIIILGKDEVGFDTSHNLLTWGQKQQLKADLLLFAANNVLLKVR